MADVSILPAEPEKPKLNKTGQALQSALDLVGRGGDKQTIVDTINRQAYDALVAGDTETSAQLAAVASNYADSAREDYGVSTDKGLAYLGNVQRDITAGKYNETPVPTPTVSTNPPPVDMAQNRLAQAVREGNPAEIAKAQQDLQRAKVAEVNARAPDPVGVVNHAQNAPPRVASRMDALTYVQTLSSELDALDGATITVNTVNQSDELLRRYRANGL